VQVAVKVCTVPPVTIGVGKNPDRHVTEVMYTTWSVYCTGLTHFQRLAGAQGLFAYPLYSCISFLVHCTGSHLYMHKMYHSLRDTAIVRFASCASGSLSNVKLFMCMPLRCVG